MENFWINCENIQSPIREEFFNMCFAIDCICHRRHLATSLTFLCPQHAHKIWNLFMVLFVWFGLTHSIIQFSTTWSYDIFTIWFLVVRLASEGECMCCLEIVCFKQINWSICDYFPKYAMRYHNSKCSQWLLFNSLVDLLASSGRLGGWKIDGREGEFTW